MSTCSVISETDVNLFKKLSNPVVCDVDISVPKIKPKIKDRPLSTKKDESLEEAVAKAMESDKEAGESDHDEKPTLKAKSNVLLNAMERQSTFKQEEKIDTAHTVEEDARSNASLAHEKTENPKPPPVATDDSIEGRLERQTYLIELQNLKKRGITLSREFTISDSAAELEFELTKQQNALTTTNTVAFLRDSLKMAVSGIEIANTKFGPFLSLEGWSDAICSDMNRYDVVLEKLYKKYFRKHQLSPIIELGWLILGSLFMTHFKNKFFGNAAASSPRFGEGVTGTPGGGLSDLMGMFTKMTRGSAPPASPPPASDDIPAAVPRAGFTNAVKPKGRSTQRRTLQPPKNLFAPS